MPETVWKKWIASIPRQWKACFLSAIAVGLLAHLYKICSWIPNWDSLVFRYDPQNMIGMGRWFLPVVCGLSSHYDLPFLNGLLAIVFHGLGAVCITRMFRVEKSVTAALIGAFIASFPTVTSVMMYNYVADGYAISFFFACLAAWFLVKEKPSYLWAALLIALSCGIYQAYITVTVMLLLMYLVQELVFGKKSCSAILKESAFFAGTGTAGLLLYYLILSLLLTITGETLLEYQGMQSTVAFSNLNLPASFYVVMHSFTDYFFDYSCGASLFTVLNSVVSVVTVALYIAAIIQNKVYRSWRKLLLLICFVACLPIGATMLAFINPTVDYHNLMKMGYCVFYLFFLIQYEKKEYVKENHNKTVSWAILLLSCLLIYNQVVIANVSYHKAQMAYEKSYGTLIRIADRIEQTEGAQHCNKIMLIGAIPGSEAYSVSLPPDITGITDTYILRKDDEMVKQSVVCSALCDYCGKEYQFLAGEEKQSLSQREEVKQMAIWPQKGSVSIVDDVIVVKLGE